MSSVPELQPRATTQMLANDVPAHVIDSSRLLADSKLIHIQHRGQLYSLRETRLGKLILTK